MHVGQNDDVDETTAGTHQKQKRKGKNSNVRRSLGNQPTNYYYYCSMRQLYKKGAANVRGQGAGRWTGQVLGGGVDGGDEAQTRPHGRERVEHLHRASGQTASGNHAVALGFHWGTPFHTGAWGWCEAKQHGGCQDAFSSANQVCQRAGASPSGRWSTRVRAAWRRLEPRRSAAPVGCQACGRRLEGTADTCACTGDVGACRWPPHSRHRTSRG